jgi:hypothetical protein
MTSLRALREHVRLVAGEAAVEQQPPAIVDDARLAALHAEPLALEPAKERRLLALVASAEDRDAPAVILQGARELFHDRRLARAADGEIADRDDEAGRMMLAEKAMPEEPEPRLHTAAKEPAQPVQKPAEGEGALAVATLENDVDRKLFKRFEPAAHGLILDLRADVVGIA